MKRIATRTLVLLAYALAALGSASACASEDTSSPFRPLDAGKKDSGGRHCDVTFCPMPASGAPCCLGNGLCGVTYGATTGCVPVKGDGG